MVTDCRGFTMIEVIVVLIIIAILAPIVVSRFSTDNTTLVAQTDILKSHLRYAQIRAMNDTVTWGINIEASQYSLYQNNVLATKALPGDNSATHPLTDGVTISSGVQTVTFNEWGSPVSDPLPINLSQPGQTPIPITITKNTGYIP